MNITVRKSEDRGHANLGWLESKHTFSFARYYDPEHMGFSELRVINEDKVQAGGGFGQHPHADMEIISYVVSGELEHKDSMGNGSVLQPGEFQVMTAGTGVTHSEFNPSDVNPVHFYQIWIMPEAKGLTPHYEDRSFADVKGLELVASKEGPMKINQDVKLYKASLQKGEELSLPFSSERSGWVQIVSGSVNLEGKELSSGDGAAISDAEALKLHAKDDAVALVFDLP